MHRKIPAEAFDHYVSLGPTRSYAAVARRYRVSARGVTKCAAREDWQGRLEKIEAAARTRADEKAAETLQAVNARHLKTLRVIQAKALAALQTLPLQSGMDAVRALDLAIRQERVVLGEPGDRQAVDLESIIRRENERWLVRDEGPETRDAPD